MRYHTAGKILRDPPAMTKPKTIHFDTLTLARRRAPRSGDRRACDADLSERVVRLSGHRPCRGAVQHGARRIRLLAHRQSDLRSAGGAHRRARRRRRRHRGGERPGGATSGDRDAAGRGRRTSSLRAPCTAARTICSTTRCRASASRRRSSIRATSMPGARRSARNAAAVRRDARQPRARRARRAAHRGAGARSRASAAGRFDVHDALPDAPVRARRGSGLPLGDQVPVRSRRRDRRPAGRQRHSSTGTSRGRAPANSRR